MNVKTSPDYKYKNTGLPQITKKLLSNRRESEIKLKCACVDGDIMVHEALKDICIKDSRFEIIGAYTNPREFLILSRDIEYDFCLLDIHMPEMDCRLVAQLINKPFIIMTNVFDNMKGILELAPMDIIPKPITTARLGKAVSKMEILLRGIINCDTKEFDLFNVAESNEKLKIRSKDILFVRVDEIDSRNKKIITKDGGEFTVMDCTLERLLSLSTRLVQVNRAELISLDAIYSFRYDTITLIKMTPKESFKQVTLSYTYRKSFLAKFS